jgi:5-methylcytosine-specific restriction endonuclease McrA
VRAYDHNWQRVRLAIIARDGCCQLRLPGCTGGADHVDHIVPLSEGGARLDPDNLRASCQWCNLSRGANRAGQMSDAFVAGVEASPSREW